MDIEKVFNDLESNQTYENEEAKKKLVELLTQSKCISLLTQQLWPGNTILFEHNS